MAEEGEEKDRDRPLAKGKLSFLVKKQRQQESPTRRRSSSNLPKIEGLVCRHPLNVLIL